MKRKWQRVLSWILTLTMLLGTFQGTGFSVFAGDDDDVVISDDAELLGDTEEPEEPDDGELTAAISLGGSEKAALNQEWGYWTPPAGDTPGNLMVYPGKSLIDNFGVKAEVEDPEDYANLEWTVKFGEAEAVAITDNDLTAGGFTFSAVDVEENVNAKVVITGTPTEALEKTLVIVTAKDADTGATASYDFYVTVADKDMTIWINPETANYNGSTTDIYNTWTVVDDTSTLTASLGHGNIIPVDFALYQGVDDENRYTQLDWILCESTDDGKVGSELFTVAAGNETSYHGLLFTHQNGTVNGGILHISGTPDETLTNKDMGPVKFWVKAKNLVEGDVEDEIRYAYYPLYIAILPLSPSVRIINTPEKMTDDDWEVTEWKFADNENGFVFDKANGNFNYVGEGEPLKKISVGYTIEDSTAQNAVAPIKYSIANVNNQMKVTDIQLSIVKSENPLSITDDSDKFIIKSAPAELKTGDWGNDYKNFTVEPVSGLKARPELYMADLVITGKELPVGGIVLANLSIKVDPAIKVSVDGDEKLVTIDEDGNNIFEIGTYEAAKNITNGINLNVSTSEEGKRVWFVSKEDEPEDYDATDVDDLPTGLQLGAAGKPDMKILGYLDPDTWNTVYKDVDGDEWYIYYDELTDCVVYIIPFLVQDNVGNYVQYYGKLNIKSADVSLELGKKDGTLQEENLSVDAHSRKWYAAEGYDRNKYVQEIKITNNGDKTLKLTASIEDGTNFVLVKSFKEDENTGADLIDETVNTVELEVAAGASKSWFVAPKAGLVSDDPNPMVYGDTLTIIGSIPADGNNEKEYKIETIGIDLSFQVNPAGLSIVAPEGDNEETIVGTPGDSFAERRIITLGIGEVKEWKLEAVGGEGNVTWSTITPGSEYDLENDLLLGTNPYDDIEPYNSLELTKEDYRSSTTELAADYNFTILSTGVIRTSGAVKQGIFTVAVMATDSDGETAHSYYEFRVVPSDEALKTTDANGKVLKSTAKDTAETFNKISDTRNLVIKTSNDSIDTIKSTITLTNTSKVDLTNVTVFVGDVQYAVAKDAGLANLAGADYKNPFAKVTYTDKSAAFGDDETGMLIGTITKNGGHITFDVNVKATHFNVVNAGYYVVPVTMKAPQIEDQTFYVLLTVDDTPTIQPLNTIIKDGEYDSVSDATQLSYLFNATALANANAEGLLANRSEFNRTKAAPYTAKVDPANILIGTKVAVGEEFSVQLLAEGIDGRKLKKGEVSFDWFKTLESDSDIPSTITMSKDGLIEGKATKPGTYYITVRAQDVRDTSNVTECYYDICIYVPGSAKVVVTISDKDVRDEANDEYLIFKGAVKGDTIDASYAKSFLVKNLETNKGISGLTATVKDDPSLSGGAAHFEATLSANAIASGTDKYAGLTVTPKDTTTAGIYKAIVVVEADQISPIEFPVIWVVTEALTLVEPTAAETVTTTGKLDYSLTFKATGAGNYYKLQDAKEILQANDILWYTTKIADWAVAPQYTVWSIAAPEGHANDEELKAMIEGLAECGLNAEQLVVGNIEDHRIKISNPATSSLENTLGLAQEGDVLTGGGTYTMQVIASVAAVKTPNLETVMLPAQEKSMTVTLTITPTGDVYVVKVVDDRNGVTKDTVTIDTHYDVSGSTNPAQIISKYTKLGAYDFRNIAVGYNENASERPRHTFTVLNNINADLKVSARVVSTDMITPSTAFVLAKPVNPETVEEVSEIKDVWLDDAGTAEPDDEDRYYLIPSERGFQVRVAKDLPAATYEGYLLIEGSGINTIAIPLSVEVSDKDYNIGVYATTDPAKVGTLQDGATVFNAKPIKVVKNGADGTSEPIAYLNNFAVGNMKAKIKRIAEVDAATGEEFGIGSDVPTKLKYTVVNKVGNEVKDYLKGYMDFIQTATNVNVPVIGDEEVRIAISVASKKTVSTDTVTLHVYYDDPNADYNESYKTVIVNYIVYDTPISNTITPTGATYDIGTVAEGYNVSENSVTFTLTNTDTNTGDVTKAIYNLKATIDPAYLFEITANPESSVMPGDVWNWTLKPIANLPAAEYTVDVTFSASNIAEVTKKVTFTVTESDTFTTYASSEGFTIYKNIEDECAGWTLEGGFKDRLENTLKALVTQSLAATTYKVKGTSLTAENPANDDYTGFLIDFNENGKSWDVNVYLYNNVLTVTKLDTCNLAKARGDLTNNAYKAGDVAFKTLNFDMLESVYYAIQTEFEWEWLCNHRWDGSYGVIVDGVDYGYVDAVYGDKIVPVKGFEDFFKKYPDGILPWKYLVPYGKKLGSAVEMSSYTNQDGSVLGDHSYKYTDIKLYQKDKAFEGWIDDEAHLVGADTYILKDKMLYNQLHSHKYYQPEDVMTFEGDNDSVKWNWEGSVETGFTGATVTLTCVDPNGCPDAAKGAKTLKAIVTPVSVNGTCTTGGHTEYRAVASIELGDPGWNGVTYVSENTALFEGAGHGHVYEYNWDKVTWFNTDGKMEDVYATVVKTCVSEFHRVEKDGDYAVTVSANKIEFFGKKATCSENGSGYYHATFDYDDVPAADKAAGKNVVSINAPVVLATGHAWKVVSADWVGDYKEGAKSVTMHLGCENDPEHTFDLLVTGANITEVERTETSATYRALGEKDGQPLTAEITYSSHTEHNWIVSWNWAAFDGKSGTGTVSVTFTCTHPDGGEVITKEGLMPEKVTATDYSATYKATTVDPDGVEVSDTKTFNLETGDEIKHTEHKWAEPVWDWSGTNKDNAKAKATFNCTVVSENHSVVVEAKPEDITRKVVGKYKVVYTATVSGPDMKNHTGKCTVKWTVNDNGTISENIIPGGSATGIGIEGLDPDDEFEFTGNAIKPVFQVVDYDRDVVLAETTDYTLQWKNNKAVGTASVTVNGKGNYTGKTVSTTFKIVAPDTTADEIVASVKSIKVSKDKFVYDGTAKYPATLTVKTKDAGTIVLTYKDGEYESSVEGKTVALTFSNNINKGKATVAATGKDGKTKKKTFSIAAADLKTLGDALTMEAGNGVYAVKAPVPSSLDVEYNDMTLVLGQDFKATYAYANKKSKNAGEKAGLVKITGKGNYKGKVEVLFDVDAFELEDEKVAVAAAPKAKSAKLKASVADANGVLIPAKQLVVTCEGASGKKLAAGEEIEVTVKGANESNISGEVKLSIKVGAADLKKAKVTGLSGKSKYTVEYTGTPIDFEEMEENPFESGKIALTGYTYGEDYEIAGYLNNNKKGTMTVILRGISEKVSGVKTLKIKVTAKQMKPAE